MLDVKPLAGWVKRRYHVGMWSVSNSLCAVLICLAPAVARAEVVTPAPLERLEAVSRFAFALLPDVQVLAALGDVCGGGAEGPGVYCTSEQRIFLVAGEGETVALYTVAHLFGHALQVNYGLADIALARIQADRSREAQVRSKVTRQVECLAGMLLARAGLEMPPLDALFATEPMTGAHWGRNPVARGPQVRIGLDARAEWFAAGYSAADPAACTVEDLSADLILQADAFNR